MAEAFAWGTLAACSLVIGAVLALVFRISLRMIGLIMAFGGGVPDQRCVIRRGGGGVPESPPAADGVIAGIFAGCFVFFGGDWLIDRSGGSGAQGRARRPGERLRDGDRSGQRA